MLDEHIYVKQEKQETTETKTTKESIQAAIHFSITK